MTHDVVRIRANPVTAAIRYLGVTRKAFADIAGVSENFMLRLDQGRQAGVPLSVLDALRAEDIARGGGLTEHLRDLYGTADLEELFQEWVTEHRQAQTIPAPSANQRENPFRRLILAVGSASKMAALLAVSDSLVARYASGTVAMPQPIRTAFEQIGYEHLAALEKGMEQWKA